MWSMVRPASYRSVNGVRPVSPSSVAAPTKRSAPALATVCTAMPRLERRDRSSQALKQAIEPVSWNRMLCAPSSDIVDEPHRSQSHGRQSPAVAVGDVVYFEAFTPERGPRILSPPPFRDALFQHAMEGRRPRA